MDKVGEWISVYCNGMYAGTYMNGGCSHQITGFDGTNLGNWNHANYNVDDYTDSDGVTYDARRGGIYCDGNGCRGLILEYYHEKKG